MNKALSRLLLNACLLAILGLAGCAAPALVFLSPQYNANKVRAVALVGIQDYPNMAGSGEIAAGIFEKYFFTAGYSYLDHHQVKAMMLKENISNADADLTTLRKLGDLLGVDALVFGQVSDFTDARDHTTVVDMPLEQSNPIYGKVTVYQHQGDSTVKTEQDVVTGYSTSESQVPVQQTETLPAHVGLSMRLIDAHSGQVLWTASASGSGPHLNEALEDASNQVMEEVTKKIKHGNS